MTLQEATSAKPAPQATSKMPSQRTLTIAVIAVAVLALGVWMVISSARRKEEFGTQALLQARMIAEQGNLPLAATEFQKVIDTYRGSGAAQEAVIGLNQVRLINGQSDLAAVDLRQFLQSNPDPKYAAPAHGLLGSALENAGLPGDAAAAFRQASDIAPLGYLKAEYLLNAARAYLAAGQPAEAEKAYQTILDSFPETVSATEAQVRLSELTAGRQS